MKKLQVFVSSTIYDLEKERAKVVEAILDSGHIPVGMELLGGANTITSTIKKNDRCLRYFLFTYRWKIWIHLRKREYRIC